MFAFAGLYEWWRDPEKSADDPERWLLSATTLTKASVPELAGIHDRNPVLLTAHTMRDWLDPNLLGSPQLLATVAREGEQVSARAEFHPVDQAVGQVRNNSPELLLPR